MKKILLIGLGVVFVIVSAIAFATPYFKGIIGAKFRTESSTNVECDSSKLDGMYFNKTDKHFYVCEGNPSTWRQVKETPLAPGEIPQ